MTNYEKSLNKAPWLDFKGNDIHEGDTIIHPSGELGIVTFIGVYKEATDQWRVDYMDNTQSRLCLQVNKKGMATVCCH